VNAFTRRLRTPAAQRGLTLVELVVVVVVVGVLAAVAAVGFQQTVARADQRASEQSLAAIAREAQLLYTLGETWQAAIGEAASGVSAPVAAASPHGYVPLAAQGTSGYVVLPAGQPVEAPYEIAWAAHGDTAVLVTESPRSGDPVAVTATSSGVVAAQVSDHDPMEVLGGEGLHLAPPTQVVTAGTAGPGIAVSWEAVLRASSYTVVATSQSGSTGGCSTSSTGCSVVGLTAGERYAVTVTASNGVVSSSPASGVPRVAGSPQNNDVDAPVLIPTVPIGSGASASAPFNMLNATRQDGEPVGAINVATFVTVWFRYTLPAGATSQKVLLTRSHVGNSISAVDVFDGTSWSSRRVGVGACGLCARPLPVQLEGGPDFLIRIAFHPGGAGTLTITDLPAPANDSLANPQAVTGLETNDPVVLPYDGRSATWEADEPRGSFGPTYGTLWWSLEVPSDAAPLTLRVARSFTSSNVGAAVTIYQGDSWSAPSVFSLTICGGCAKEGIVTLTPGNTYLMRVMHNQTGSITLTRQ
jgi:prepilin-type N-terminal cleavage/methylation domain-containing protein